jgi:hypothetical protein
MEKDELLQLAIDGYLKEVETITYIECPVCHAKLTYKWKSSLRNIKSIHGANCSKYYQNQVTKELGEQACKKFSSTYRHAKERCTNKNSKDYYCYKGKWGFTDYVDYHFCCYSSFRDAWLRKIENISIDRIDGNLGYEKDNVRFISMGDNLRNKDRIKPVMALNIETNECLTANSLASLVNSNSTTFKSLSAMHHHLKNGGLYKKKWKVVYQ